MRKIRTSGFKLLLVMLCLILLWSFPLMTDADGMDFDVRIFPPETQRRDDVPGFDLLLEPGAMEEVEIEVRNLSDEPIELIIEIATATTDDGGTIFYRPREGLIRDNTLPYAMEDIATIEGNRFPLEGGEQLRIPITINMPETRFDGMILGGISILQYVNMEEASGQGGMIINRFWTEIPLRLQQNENPVQPDLKLLSVGASQRNWRNIFSANLQNPEMMLIHMMEVHAFVRHADRTETLFEERLSNMQVAPNSNFTLAIPLGGERFQAGEYDLHLEVVAYNGSWSFHQRFYVSAEEAAAFNATDVTITRIPLWIFIAAGGALVMLLFILYMVLFRRKSKKTRNNALEDVMKQINNI